jgi:hypothetical protein
VISVAGPSERVLRSSSLLAGCLLLPAMLVLARRVSGWAAALFALALLVPNPILLRYSTEFKPYALDALVATVLCLLTLQALEPEQDERRSRALFTLAVIGALATWCSLPAIFVLAGSTAALALDAWRRQAGPAQQAAPFALGALWALCAGLQYLAFLRASPADALELHTYWARQGAFAPLPPRSLADLSWYPGKFFYLFDVFVAPGGFGLRYLAGALWLWGMRALWRSQPPLCALMGTPLVLLFCASAVHKYVFADRLVLFLVPLIVLPVVVALAELAELRGTSTQLMAAALAALLCVGSSWELARTLRLPAPSSSIEQVVDYLRAQYRPGDRLYVEQQAEWIYAFYARRAHFELPYPIADDRLRDATPSFETLDTFRGAPRVWLVLPTATGTPPPEPGARDGIARVEKLIAGHLNTIGHVRDVLDGGNTRLYLYDLSALH